MVIRHAIKSFGVVICTIPFFEIRVFWFGNGHNFAIVDQVTLGF